MDRDAGSGKLGFLISETIEDRKTGPAEVARDSPVLAGISRVAGRRSAGDG
jgi:hypothetical protein